VIRGFESKNITIGVPPKPSGSDNTVTEDRTAAFPPPFERLKNRARQRAANRFRLAAFPLGGQGPEGAPGGWKGSAPFDGKGAVWGRSGNVPGAPIADRL